MGLDPNVFACHVGPLIRKEKAFAAFRRSWRAKVFKLLFDFARRADFRYHCFCIDKKDLLCSVSLIEQRLINGDGMTASEHAFFGGPRLFKRNVLKYLKRKQIL